MIKLVSDENFDGDIVRGLLRRVPALGNPIIFGTTSRGKRIAVIQSPEYRESEQRDREALDQEYRATGTIASTPVTDDDVEVFEAFIQSLRQARESAGLSLDEVASRSGVDKAQLSRLENGKVHDPLSSTLARYARAIGKRLAWSLEDVQSRQPR